MRQASDAKCAEEPVGAAFGAGFASVEWECVAPQADGCELVAGLAFGELPGVVIQQLVSNQFRLVRYVSLIR